MGKQKLSWELIWKKKSQAGSQAPWGRKRVGTPQEVQRRNSKSLFPSIRALDCKRRLHFQFPGPKSIWKRWLLAEPLRVISPEQEEIFRACWAIVDCNRPLASLENRIQQGMSPQSLWAVQHPATEIEMSHGIRDAREPECLMAARVSLPGLCILFNLQTLSSRPITHTKKAILAGSGRKVGQFRDGIASPSTP